MSAKPTAEGYPLQIRSSWRAISQAVGIRWPTSSQAQDTSRPGRRRPARVGERSHVHDASPDAHPGRSGAQRLKNAFHELAHIRLPDPGLEGRPDCRGVVEVEAESVAFMVCASIGIDTASTACPMWRPGAGRPRESDRHGQPGDRLGSPGDRPAGLDPYGPRDYLGHLGG
jgi:hypothetical protein